MFRWRSERPFVIESTEVRQGRYDICNSPGHTIIGVEQARPLIPRIDVGTNCSIEQSVVPLTSHPQRLDQVRRSEVDDPVRVWCVTSTVYTCVTNAVADV